MMSAGLIFGVGALHLCIAVPIRHGGKIFQVLQHSSCDRGTERKEFLEHFAMLLMDISDQMWGWFGQKIAENSAVGGVVSHTPQEPQVVLSCARGWKGAALPPYSQCHSEVLKGPVKWERMMLP